MHLLLRRSQRDDGWVWSSMTFLLDARLDLDAEEQHLFEKYQLYGVAVYDSDARVQHAHSAMESYASSEKSADAVPLFPAVDEIHIALGNAFASIWHLGAGITHDIMSTLSLQISLGSLVGGQHIESQDLEELLSVAANIHSAVGYLANYLNVALTFDGREELTEH
jgi:hypothetical protein